MISSRVKRVGIIGGGQLAWMMADAAQQLGVELVVQTPTMSDPAAAIAQAVVLAAVDDAEATADLADRCDVITFENEFVNLAALKPLVDRGVCFRPALSSLAPLLDKFDQRQCLRQLGLPTPRYQALNGEPRSAEFLQKRSSWPAVIKVRRHGYDGQGTHIVKSWEHWQDVESKLAGHPLLWEEFVPFDRELALMAARGLTGEIITYPLVETQQEEQVCRRVFAPAPVSDALAQQAAAMARSVLTTLDVVGIFGFEFFLTPAGELLINEIAPRTHNSGHYTIDACQTSQFEQHLRAVCGLPLGKPDFKPGWQGAAMVNLLGFESSQSTYMPQRQQIATDLNAQVYWYNKAEIRPGRKLGHATLPWPNPTLPATQTLAEAVAELERIWYGQAR